jgi:hypothetical protein
VMVWSLILMCSPFGWYVLGSRMPWWLRYCMICFTRNASWFVLDFEIVVGSC